MTIRTAQLLTLAILLSNDNEKKVPLEPRENCQQAGKNAVNWN
uniref:Uncharacterized protein n=1 Tax=Rhizophora mucronata TaxID=61149 RepID=A0A2P2J1E0_RHIMU